MWILCPLCPCGFAIHRGISAGLRPAQIEYPQLVTRGLQIPEDKKQLCKKHFVPLSLWICNPQGINSGSVIRAEFLFISSLHEQRRNRTKEETRRLIAKKLKIKACFPKLAKRPRFARLNEARSSRKTSSIFYTLFC